jgi:fructose-bisphosphate aldolase class I
MSNMDLVSVAEAMVAEGKGILAIDESSGTIARRFKTINVECTEENRRAYREMLLTTPGLGKHISGLFLTMRRSGSPPAKVPCQGDAGRGIIPASRLTLAPIRCAAREKITGA